MNPFDIAAECIETGGFKDKHFVKQLSQWGEKDLESLFLAASIVRTHYKQKRVKVCSILSAKTGRCSEDCRFCAQSLHYNTHCKIEPLVSHERIVEVATKVKEMGVKRLGLVSSGVRLTPREVEALCRSIEFVTTKLGLNLCASFGMLGESELAELKSAGISRYNHNLETSQRYYPNVCTTHSFSERIKTIERVKSVGLELCSGGILGMGETEEDRISMAFMLRELDVDVVSLNILNPIKGTPFGNRPLMAPREALKWIAIYRLCLPTKDIKLSGGREVALRDLQSWLFFAGANSILVGNYLTTPGRPACEDFQLIKDLGLEVDDT